MIRFNKTTYTFAALAAAVLLFQASASSDDLFQASTLNALMGGVFDGTTSFGELRERGDIGIGTFDALDGEMIGVGGEFYRARSDGELYPVENATRTPFACVTFFEADTAANMAGPINMTEVEAKIDGMRHTSNLFYAIRIDGTFDYVKVRAPHAQSKPYPTLVDALKNQSIFEFSKVNGTVVGFWCPEYVKGLNVPGYHLHFVTEDRTSGGHLLDFTAQNVTVGVDETSEFSMALPDSSEFYSADLTGSNETQVNAVEGKK